MEAAIEAFHRVLRGAKLEIKLYARSWGFEPQQISKKVHLWHGELDINSPPAMGHYIADSLPVCSVNFYEDEGHISQLIHHMDDILKTLCLALTDQQCTFEGFSG